MDPEEFLELNKNGNTRKNSNAALSSYNRVMKKLGEDLGEEFVPLETTPAAQLPYLLMKYLQAAKREDDTVYSSGSLRAHFNSLANILSARQEDPVDIKNDVRFNKVKEMLRVRATQSKAMGRGPGCDAKKPLKAEHMIAAREAGTIGNSNPKALSTLVWVGAVCGWGNRTGQECKDMTNGDILFGPLNAEKNRHDWIKLHERLTKTRRGSNPGDAKELTPTIFPMDEYPETCYVRAIEEYQRRKTPEQRASDLPFFLNPNPRAMKNPQGHKWYSSIPMGINRMPELIKEALEEAGVDVSAEEISAISVRKAMIQCGVDANMPPVNIARIAGQKSLASQEKYISSEGLHHVAGSRAIHRRFHHVEGVKKKYEDELLEAEVEQHRNLPGSRDRPVERGASSRERSRSPGKGSDPGNRNRDESSFR